MLGAGTLMLTRSAKKDVILRLPFGVPSVKLKLDTTPTRALVASPNASQPTSLKPRKAKTRPPRPIFPMERFLDGLLSVVSETLHATDAVPKYGGFESVGNALLHFGVLNKESRDTLRSYPAYLPLCAFLNALLRSADKDRFLKGIPPSIDLFQGTHGSKNLVSPKAAHFFAVHGAEPSLTVRKVVLDRYISASLLVDHSTSSGVTPYVEYHIGDEGLRLPLRVQHFLGRCRALAQGLRIHRDAVQFQECEVCNKLCFVGTLSAYDDEEEDHEDDQPTDVILSRRYWEIAGGLFPAVRADTTICCPACEKKLVTEREIAQCVKIVELMEYDAPADKSGPARVSAALRAAIKRNELVGRRLRTPPSPLTLIPMNVQYNMRRFTMDMLNVDLGFLVACASSIETGAERCNALPPTFLNWRQNQFLYGSGLINVKKLYWRYQELEETLLEHTETPSKFLTKCKAKAAVLVRGF